ncbi:MAG: sulfurtransferase, partial [Terriglobales bacterium]
MENGVDGMSNTKKKAAALMGAGPSAPARPGCSGAWPGVARVLLVLALALAAMGGVAAAQQNGSLVVTPQWLAGHLHDANLVLLQVGDRGAFGKAHIPGAQFITLKDISADTRLTLELPPIKTLTSAFASRGISNDSRVVVYFDDRSGVSRATRVMWTLAYYGLGERAALLDGGLAGWRNAGGAVTGEGSKPAPGSLTPHVHPEFFADAAWVSGHLRQGGISL